MDKQETARPPNGESVLATPLSRRLPGPVALRSFLSKGVPFSERRRIPVLESVVNRPTASAVLRCRNRAYVLLTVTKREHFHYRLLDSGMTARQVLGTLTGLAAVLAAIGVLGERLGAPDFAMFSSWAVVGAISCEMVSGFMNMRGELSCHLFGRVPGFAPSSAAHSDISRIFEIWSECLDRSGGPFLFGDFCIADAVYFPVLTRLRTYGVPLPGTIMGYERALDTLPAVRKLIELARTEPRTPIYDDYVRGLGGDPDAALAA